MRFSAVIVSRNDNYGGHLNTRATFCFNTMLDAFDEVIYVDWNTEEGKPPLTDDIEIVVNSDRLKVIVVPPEMAMKLMGEEGYKTGQKCCEVLARNIGIRRASGDIIVSTNIDVVCSRRAYLEEVCRDLKPGDLITVKRNSLERDVVLSIHEQTRSYQLTRDSVVDYCGVETMKNGLMFPYLKVNKEILDKVPIEHHYNASSIFGGCGDFQMAHKDTWYSIRGFEENQLKRNFNDTNVQYKVIMAGGAVTATNLPPVYHINHEYEKNVPSNTCVPIPFTTNSETWGFSEENFEIRTRDPVSV